MYEQNNIVSGGQSDTSKDNEEGESDQDSETETGEESLMNSRWFSKSR